MKRMVTGLGIIALVGIMAMPVFARSGGRGHGDRQSGPCWDRSRGEVDLTEEQASKLEKLQEDFYADTAEIRHKLWAKTDQLGILLDRSDPDVERAKSLQKEISNLRGEMAQKRLQRDIEAKKIAPEATFGRGHGKGKYGGRHMNKGPDGYHRGGGHRPCWK